MQSPSGTWRSRSHQPLATVCNVCSRHDVISRGFLDSSLIHLCFILIVVSISFYHSLSLSISLYQSLSVSISLYQSLSVSISLYRPPILRIQLGIAFQHHLSPSIPDIDLKADQLEHFKSEHCGLLGFKRFAATATK